MWVFIAKRAKVKVNGLAIKGTKTSTVLMFGWFNNFLRRIYGNDHCLILCDPFLPVTTSPYLVCLAVRNTTAGSLLSMLGMKLLLLLLGCGVLQRISVQQYENENKIHHKKEDWQIRFQ